MIDGRSAIQVARVIRHLFCLFCCKWSDSPHLFQADSAYCRRCGQKICRYHLTESFSRNKYKFTDEQSYLCAWTCINCICTNVDTKYNINTSIQFVDNKHYWQNLKDKQKQERFEYIIQHNKEYIYLENNDWQRYLSDQHQNQTKLKSISSSRTKDNRRINLHSKSNVISIHPSVSCLYTLYIFICPCLYTL